MTCIHTLGEHLTELRSVVMVEGVVARFDMRDRKTVIYGVVVEAASWGARVVMVRPLGCRSTIAIEIAGIRRASIAQNLRWAESQQIANAQRERFDKSEVTR